jgi:hypothetical protein
MTQQPSLPLPDLAPGEQPPENCPHCGASSVSKDGYWIEYQCGARYFKGDDEGEWRPTEKGLCSSPTPEAVVAAIGNARAIRAVLANLTDEQRAVAVHNFEELHETLEESLERNADALEKGTKE